MLDLEIVPHGDRVVPPLQADLILGDRCLRRQIGHQVMGFRHEVLAVPNVLEVEEIREMGRECRVHEQDLFARLRVGEHNRMLGGRVLLGHRVALFLRHLGAKDMLGAVLRV